MRATFESVSLLAVCSIHGIVYQLQDFPWISNQPVSQQHIVTELPQPGGQPAVTDDHEADMCSGLGSSAPEDAQNEKLSSLLQDLMPRAFQLSRSPIALSSSAVHNAPDKVPDDNPRVPEALHRQNKLLMHNAQCSIAAGEHVMDEARAPKKSIPSREKSLVTKDNSKVPRVIVCGMHSTEDLEQPIRIRLQVVNAFSEQQPCYRTVNTSNCMCFFPTILTCKIWCI